ncbi:MAG: methyltransferase domain-containing protein [Anaerolineales bacterium]|jgi:ubiquinone/menaquinone biosynthesis C-methylase UbiE
MSHSNAWSNPSIAGAAEAVQMAAFLEERSHTPDVLEVNAAFCTFLDPQPGECILEVGSGSGIICRLIALRLQARGSVVGVDISPDIVTEARKYALQEGLADRITFKNGEGKSLAYPNVFFDCACAARLLLHADDPDPILREMVRVVKRGGRVVVMDWDFETVTVDHTNRDLTRRLLHWRNDHHGGDNWSGRQLWRRMAAAGLQRLSVHPVVSVVHNETDGLTQSLWRAAQVARDGGGISPEEQDEWVGELKNRIKEGTFFASIVYFIVRGFVV